MNARSRFVRYQLTHLTDWLEQLDEATANGGEDELHEVDSSIWLSELPLTGWELRRSVASAYEPLIQSTTQPKTQGDSRWMPSTTCSPTC